MRFAEEPPSSAGPSSHVHFDEKLHDSVVMVTPEDDGNFMVKVCLCVCIRHNPSFPPLSTSLAPLVFGALCQISIVWNLSCSCPLCLSDCQSVRPCSPPPVVFLCSDNLASLSCLCLSRMRLIRQLLCQRECSPGHGGLRLICPADSPLDRS